MSRKGKIPGLEEIATIEKYLRGEDSLYHLATLLGVHHSNVQQWLQTYQSLGPNALLNTSKNAIYPAELKTKAVENYLAGDGSLLDICKRYGIKSNSQLRNWILKYNGHENLKTSGTGGTSIMTKGRATTYDERVEIVKCCIENQNNYAEIAQKFQVSYQHYITYRAIKVLSCLLSIRRTITELGKAPYDDENTMKALVYSRNGNIAH